MFHVVAQIHLVTIWLYAKAVTGNYTQRSQVALKKNGNSRLTLLGVRELTETDLPACIELGARMHNESIYSALDYSPEKCLVMAKRGMTDSDELWICAEKNGVITGMMGARISESFFGAGLVTSDYFVFVDHAYRGGMSFIRLVQKYVAWARERGSDLVFLSQSTGLERQRISSLYSRLGFEYVGDNYVYIT